MKKFKMIRMMALCLSIFITSIAYAQPPAGGGEGRAQQGPPPIPSEKKITKMVNSLANDLFLSEAQTTKILSLYIDHFAEVKEKTSNNSRPKREEMDAMTKNFEKEVKGILNKEQQSKYLAYLKRQKKLRQPR